MIKEIDAKIAELEKEEEEEKRKEQEKQMGRSGVVLNPIEEPQKEEKVIETRPVNTPEGSPKVDEVVHSNMVNFENFSMKEEPKQEEKKEEEEKEKLDVDYDDFFDDFFFDE